MQDQHPSLAVVAPSGRASLGPTRPRWLTGRWIAGIIFMAALAAAGLSVASAERDAWLRTHPRVPVLVGKTLAEAARMMVPLHFGIIVTGSSVDPDAPAGVVLAQNPPPGRLLPMGSIVQLKVSQGSGIVPRLRGGPAHGAAQQLEAVGLRLGRVRYIEDDAAPDTVLEQFTPPGRHLDPNSPVDVLVSRGHVDATASSALPGNPPPVVRRSKGALPPAPVSVAPGTASPALGPAPGAVAVGQDPQMPILQERREGGIRVGSAPADCAAHSEHERAEVCGQPAGDRGTESDIHRPEHRSIPSSP